MLVFVGWLVNGRTWRDTRIVSGACRAAEPGRCTTPREIAIKACVTPASGGAPASAGDPPPPLSVQVQHHSPCSRTGTCCHQTMQQTHLQSSSDRMRCTDVHKSLDQAATKSQPAGGPKWPHGAGHPSPTALPKQVIPEHLVLHAPPSAAPACLRGSTAQQP